MANTGYCALEGLKTELGISGTAEDATLTTLIDVASREIDGYCGRRFWQDDTVQVQYFHAYDHLLCEVEDISTTTGLIVAVDLIGYGTYNLTLTLNSDFILEPINATNQYPVRPYEELRIVPFAQNYFPLTPRPGVKVTAQFGWPEIPVDLARVCLDHAKAAYRAPDLAVVSERAGAYEERIDPTLASKGFSPKEQAVLGRYAKPAIG